MKGALRDCWIIVLSNMDLLGLTALLRVRLVCRSLRDAVDSSVVLWSRAFVKRFYSWRDVGGEEAWEKGLANACSPLEAYKAAHRAQLTSVRAKEEARGKRVQFSWSQFSELAGQKDVRHCDASYAAPFACCFCGNPAPRSKYELFAGTRLNSRVEKVLGHEVFCSLCSTFSKRLEWEGYNEHGVM